MRLQTRQFVTWGAPFLTFMVGGSYGLSFYVDAKFRLKEERRRQEDIMDEVRKRDRLVVRKRLPFDPEKARADMAKALERKQVFANKPTPLRVWEKKSGKEYSEH